MALDGLPVVCLPLAQAEPPPSLLLEAGTVQTVFGALGWG